MSLAPPPELTGRGPTLITLHEVEAILRASDEPLSLNEIKRRMKAKTVRHDTVRICVEELKRFSLVTEGSKGVLWTLHDDRSLWQDSTPL
ncbi:MAG: hypothetical protein ACPGQL_05765 [Thermoplasmatota archaeon]